MHERYSIEVDDESVMIYGDLSMEEAFDFLNFFEKKGYNRLTLGHENSTISMMKKSIEEAQEAVRIAEHISTEKFYESLFVEQSEKSKRHIQKIQELESLVKKIMEDKKERINEMEMTIQMLCKRLESQKLENSEYVKEIMNEIEKENT